MALGDKATKQELEQRAKNMQQELDALKETIESMPEDEWRPQLGAYYHYVRSTGTLEQAKYGNDPSKDRGRAAMKNMFRSKAEAELHKLRLESMANRWKPEKSGATVYFWNADYDTVDSYSAVRVPLNREFSTLYLMGNTHPTAAAARAWYDKYGKAWEALLA